MKHRSFLTWIFVFLCVSFIALTAQAQNQGRLPSPKESRPADPLRLEWDPRVNPDTMFYQLAADQRIEDKSSTTWTVPTLGFRDMRIVVFMTEAEKTSKVAPPSLRISAIVRDGDKEFEISKKEVSIETGAGKTSGDTLINNIYSDSTIIKVEARNMNGKLHLSTYLVK